MIASGQADFMTVRITVVFHGSSDELQPRSHDLLLVRGLHIKAVKGRWFGSRNSGVMSFKPVVKSGYHPKYEHVLIAGLLN